MAAGPELEETMGRGTDGKAGVGGRKAALTATETSIDGRSNEFIDCGNSAPWLYSPRIVA